MIDLCNKDYIQAGGQNTPTNTGPVTFCAFFIYYTGIYFQLSVYSSLVLLTIVTYTSLNCPVVQLA